MRSLSERGKMLIEMYLNEDSGEGDPSSIPLREMRGSARIRPEGNCVLSGSEAVVYLFEHLGCRIVKDTDSGIEVGAGEEIFIVEGELSSILRGERIALNILSRMSSIATYAYRLVRSIEGTGCRLAGTRKTTPGFSYFEKEALIDGGALPHRRSLSEMAMVKDNHLTYLQGAGIGPGEAVARIRSEVGSFIRIEVEAEEEDTAMSALEAGADIILLDNRTPVQFSYLARKIRARAKKLGRSVLIEASGGITEDVLLLYAKDADMISMGALTSPPVRIGFKMDAL
jgi:nicotinate-nucleotide pyrophosphorylase (carboxylating)